LKLIILAGGSGKRLSGNGFSMPKPLVPIGSKPLIWHIMKIFAYQGLSDFILCLGYKANMIEAAVKNFREVIKGDWKVQFLDTGIDTPKLQRIQKASSHISNEPNLLSYADNLCNLNLEELLNSHKAGNKLLTLTGVKPHSPYGHIFRDDGKITFKEKPIMNNSLINAGFMVFEPGFIDYISGCTGELETDIISSLAADEQLNVYEHPGDWNGINNTKEYEEVCQKYSKGEVYWETWKK
jgi:glucose-1-phosphate cytidylyltransferase